VTTSTISRGRSNPLFDPMLIQAPFASEATGGRELVNLDELGLFAEILGAEGGYQNQGDILYALADGVDPNALWAEFQQTLEIFNARRQTIVSLMTYPVTQLIETVPQVGDVEFEEASEYGIPKAVGIRQDYFQMAYDFKDYDLATRYTWKYLRDADARAVQAVHNAILTADNRLVFRKVMEAIFDNRNRTADIRNQPYNVYALYNNDGTIPPTYKNTTFLSTHDHYLVSGAAAFQSIDIEDGINLIAEHGYGQEQGTTFVVLMNSAQMAVARTFRAGATINGAVCNYDFIPAPNQPALFVPNAEGLIGVRPPNSWNGLPVVGSYKNALLVEEDYIPPGYLLVLGSGGTGNLQNPVGLREHANTAYRGLRLLPGNQQRYPLVDSYYSRAFGTGIRQRAGASVVQIKASGSYDIPTAYTRGGGLL